MVIGCLQLEIHLPAASSLKDKRQVVSSLRDRLRRRNISFAEVAHQELWQRAGLAVVAVAAQKSQLDSLFEAVQDEVARLVPGEVIHHQVEYL